MKTSLLGRSQTIQDSIVVQWHSSNLYVLGKSMSCCYRVKFMHIFFLNFYASKLVLVTETITNFFTGSLVTISISPGEL